MTIWFTKTLVEHWVASLYMVSGHCKLIRKTKLYATDEKKAMVKIDDINSFFCTLKREHYHSFCSFAFRVDKSLM